MLNGVDSANLPDSPSGLLEHSFGINQVIATLAVSCAMATRLGTLDQIVRQVTQADLTISNLSNPSASGSTGEIAAVGLAQVLNIVRTPETPNNSTTLKSQTRPEVIYGCRLELAHSEPVIEVGQGKNERKNIRPDALGMLIYDTELVLPTITKFAHLERPTGASANQKIMVYPSVNTVKGSS